MTKEVSGNYLEQVWIRFQSGEQGAFAVLYNLHIDKLYRYGTKLCKNEQTVKDALQELFLELFLKRDKIKISPENLRFYLFLALKRTLIKKMRADRRITYSFNENVDFEPEYSIEFQIIEKEREKEINRKVINALNLLPSKQKEAVYLRFNESLAYEEIAVILKITVESVRKQVYRALKTVREIIGNEGNTLLFAFFIKKS
ncbi:MAG: sigma-70 family RNA polymerase sigma factor [Mariniphaga sp.]